VRAALDTNVLVSAVATRGLCADVFNVVLAEHELILGKTVLAELRRVLREKIRVPVVIVDEFETLLRHESLVVTEAKLLALTIRDRSDVPVLSEAVAGKADVLVTGDRDLLELEARLPIQIMAPRAFWERLRQTAPPR
jgi:putative PIN family toxin of toxin-antitoxin system